MPQGQFWLEPNMTYSYTNNSTARLVYADCRVCFSYIGKYTFTLHWKPNSKGKKGIKCSWCGAYNIPEEILKTSKISEYNRWRAHVAFVEERLYLNWVEEYTGKVFNEDEVIRLTKPIVEPFLKELLVKNQFTNVSMPIVNQRFR
jgi:hypothetical protein